MGCDCRGNDSEGQYKTTSNLEETGVDNFQAKSIEDDPSSANE